MAWIYVINTIFDGEYVKSKVINRPLDQLVERTQYLYDLIQNMEAGQLLVAPNVTVKADTVPGQPVYYNEVESRFEPCLAEVETGQNNYGRPTAKAQIRGLILTKHTDNTADIALYGRIKQSIFGIDWASICDGGVQLHGDVYVSAAVAGNLSASTSHLEVRVGSLDGEGNLYFTPDVEGSLRDHVHYKWQLTENLGSAITDQGWLLAAVFTANGISVPAGYTHGYNVSTDADLSSHFPPTPVVANNLFVDGLLVEENEDYLVDENGIWYKGSDTPWSKPTFFYTAELDTPTGIVTSLQPATAGIPVQAQNSSGEASTIGDLYLALLAADLFAGSGQNAHLALSNVVRSDGKLELTPVVPRVIPGIGVSIDASYGDDTDGYYGPMTINAGVSAGVQVNPVLAELNNTAEDKYGDIPVVSFPNGRDSTSVIYKVAVPTNVAASRKLKLVLDLLAAQAVSDSLDAAYQLIRPATAVPTSWTALTSVAAGIAAAGKPNTVETDEIDVEPGDTVLVRLTQPLTPPSYDLMISKVLAVIGS